MGRKNKFIKKKKPSFFKIYKKHITRYSLIIGLTFSLTILMIYNVLRMPGENYDYLIFELVMTCFFCIITSLIILYKWPIHKNDPERMINWANIILKDKKKSVYPKTIIFFALVFAIVTLGWTVITYLNLSVKSDIHASAFGGGIVGSFISFMIFKTDQMFETWDEKMNPTKYIKSLVLFVTVGIFSWLANLLIVLIYLLYFA